MVWAGSTVNCLWNYLPVTIPAIKWIKVADGNYKGVDRGVAEDVFEGECIFRGTESELSTLETVLANNRENFSATFGTGEEIFGADINYSGALDVTVIQYGEIKKVSFPAYEMPMRLRLLGTPSFTGSASLSDLTLADFAYKTGSEFDMMKAFALDRSAAYLDGETDPGICRARFMQTQDEMKAIRRYLLTTARTNSVSFPSFGLSEPFGQRMGSGPFNCKIIDWRDLGRKDFRFWELEIAFARVI